MIAASKELRKKTNSPLPTFSRGSTYYLEWLEYFERHLQWIPYQLREMLSGKQATMTVPAERPGFFDADFAPQPGWRSRHKQPSPRESHPTGAEVEVRRRFIESQTPVHPNTFVAADHLLYPDIYARHQEENGRNSRAGARDGRAGLWVPLEWIPTKRMGAWQQVGRLKPARELKLETQPTSELPDDPIPF